MANELSEKVYPDGTVVKLRDDTAREQINNLINPIKVQSLTIDVPAVSAGRDCVVYKALPVVSGYKAVGIVGITTLGNIKPLALNDFFVNNTSAYVAFYNNTSSATTSSSVTVDILYIKT